MPRPELPQIEGTENWIYSKNTDILDELGNRSVALTGQDGEGVIMQRFFIKNTEAKTYVTIRKENPVQSIDLPTHYTGIGLFDATHTKIHVGEQFNMGVLYDTEPNELRKLRFVIARIALSGPLNRDFGQDMDLSHSTYTPAWRY